MSSNHWSNRLTFIITTSAFAVGLGNIWRFPYMVGEGGGGAFLLVYVGLILFIGLPILIMEIGLGRMSQTTPLLGYGKLAKKSPWNNLGWLGVMANLLIMSYYVMIMAWVLIYFYEAAVGRFEQYSAQELPAHFDAITTQFVKVLLTILGIMILSFLILRKDLQHGLERYAKWMMIGLVLILIGLAIWASTLDNAIEGYRWYLTPDFSKITLDTVMGALGQLFFSVGVGMTIAFAFGSYSAKQDNLVTASAWIIFADTFFAILAGFMIFPALFSLGISPDSGPNLVFVTMAAVFAKLEYGQLIGALFFLLLFLAGFTSLITSIQGLKDSFQDKYRLSPIAALMVPITFIALGSIPSVFSFLDNPIRIFGATIYESLDFLTNTIMLPLSGLGIVLFTIYKIGFFKFRDHLYEASHPTKIGTYWKVIAQVLIPLAIIIILLNGLL